MTFTPATSYLYPEVGAGKTRNLSRHEYDGETPIGRMIRELLTLSEAHHFRVEAWHRAVGLRIAEDKADFALAVLFRLLREEYGDDLEHASEVRFERNLHRAVCGRCNGAFPESCPNCDDTGHEPDGAVLYRVILPPDCTKRRVSLASLQRILDGDDPARARVAVGSLDLEFGFDVVDEPG